MFEIFKRVVFCAILIFIVPFVYAKGPRFFWGVSTDIVFLTAKSELRTSSELLGIEVEALNIDSPAFNRELGIRFITGFQFMKFLDIYAGVGGASNTATQQINDTQHIYVQKAAFSTEINAKATLASSAHTGNYIMTGIGLQYVLLTSAGGTEDLDLGIRWNNINMYINIATGLTVYPELKKTHRFNIGVHGKYIVQKNFPYTISSNGTVHDFKIGMSDFLLGMNLEYSYLF